MTSYSAVDIFCFYTGVQKEMDRKELKAALKKCQIRQGQSIYKDTLKHCKAILKHDKTNYNALVFVAVATEGLDQGDKALLAYNKATRVDFIRSSSCINPPHYVPDTTLPFIMLSSCLFPPFHNAFHIYINSPFHNTFVDKLSIT